MNDDADMPEGAEEIPENAEALVFGRIVRYISERLGEFEADADAQDVGAMSGLFAELADAFEHTGGFEFSADQALPLSHAFAMLEGSIRLLAEQASGEGQTNAAAKMEWAALQAKGIQAELEERHLQNSGGVVAFSPDGEEPA